MKSSLRKSAASGSTIAKIDKAIRRGWQPGYPVWPFIRKGVVYAK